MIYSETMGMSSEYRLLFFIYLFIYFILFYLFIYLFFFFFFVFFFNLNSVCFEVPINFSIQSNLLIPTLDTTTKYVILTI